MNDFFNVDRVSDIHSWLIVFIVCKIEKAFLILGYSFWVDKYILVSIIEI